MYFCFYWLKGHFLTFSLQELTRFWFIFHIEQNLTQKVQYLRWVIRGGAGGLNLNETLSHSNGKVFDHGPKEVEVLSKMTIALCVQLIKLKAVGQSKMKITLTFWSNDFFYRLNDINKSYSSIQKCYLKCSNFWHIHECATHNSTKQWTERTTIYLLHFVYLQW